MSTKFAMEIGEPLELELTMKPFYPTVGTWRLWCSPQDTEEKGFQFPSLSEEKRREPPKEGKQNGRARKERDRTNKTGRWKGKHTAPPTTPSKSEAAVKIIH